MRTPESKRHWSVRMLRGAVWMGVGALILFVGLWNTLSLYYSNLPAMIRPWAAGLFIASSTIALFMIRPFRRGLLVFLCLSAGIYVYWLLIPPSNERRWRKDVSVLPWAEVDGNRVTVHNIRNSEYRTATDFDLRHYDRTFDLNQLRAVDFFMCFWAPIPFCHTMLSFDFEDGGALCVSIETRPEEHEGYSVIASSFKQYELVYVAGDERDLVRLRTNFRDEAVHLYHINTTPEAMRRLFLRYCDRMNDLRAHAEWYCLLTRNCTTDIPRRSGKGTIHFPESWKVLVNGFLDEFLYKRGSLDRSVPLKELRKLGHINTRAQLADRDPEFSRRIREPIPNLQPGAFTQVQGSDP